MRFTYLRLEFLSSNAAHEVASTTKALPKDYDCRGFHFSPKAGSLRSNGFDQEPDRGYGVLRRLFSTFPGGARGLGLLMVRAAVGIVAVAYGGTWLADSGYPTIETLIVGIATVVSGAALLIGFFTPVAGAIVDLVALGVFLSRYPLPALSSFEAKLLAFLMAMLAFAVILLGPGALSLDSRLFGRREIIIPRNTASRGSTSPED